MMLEVQKFDWYAGWTLNYAKFSASEKTTEVQKEAIRKHVSSARRLYQKELFSRMLSDDQELLASMLQFWANLGIVFEGVHSIEKAMSVFDIARRRLGDEKKVLRIIYDSKQVPTPLRKIMRSFVVGQATQEETAVHLDDCTAKLNRWLPELLVIE